MRLEYRFYEYQYRKRSGACRFEDRRDKFQESIVCPRKQLFISICHVAGRTKREENVGQTKICFEDLRFFSVKINSQMKQIHL